MDEIKKVFRCEDGHEFAFRRPTVISVEEKDESGKARWVLKILCPICFDAPESKHVPVEELA